MRTHLKQIIAGARELWIYCLSFIILFDLVFIRTFSDSSETYGMFLLLSIWLQVLTLFLFTVMSVVMQYLQVKSSRFFSAVILFIVAEISAFIVTGNVVFFGLFEKHSPLLPAPLNNSLFIFHVKRDLALSLSGLLAVVIYYLSALLLRKRDHAAI